MPSILPPHWPLTKQKIEGLQRAIRVWFNPIFCPRRFTEAHLGRLRVKSTAWPSGSNCLLWGVRLKQLRKLLNSHMQTVSVIILCLKSQKICIATKQNEKSITYLRQQHLKMLVHRSNNVSVVFVFFKHGSPAIFLHLRWRGKDTRKVLYQFKSGFISVQHLTDDTIDLTYSFTLLSHSEGGAIFRLGAF